MRIRGTVYLVGAGPGASDLITVRGLRILQSADVVMHDDLIGEELLQEARADAVVISVGKRGYCIGSTRQEQIHELMQFYALAGMSICRLKGGDPFIFGRGGEEAEFLAQAGISYQVIPGVTSALAAAAESYIPLTHRRISQSITFVTGHHDPDSDECQLDWSALARMSTVVFYMGMRHIGKIAKKLMEHGLAMDTPAAVLAHISTRRQQIVTAHLDQIDEESQGVSGPALLIVGETVSCREQLLGLMKQLTSDHVEVIA